MNNPVCWMLHVKDPFLLSGKSSPCSFGSVFPFLLRTFLHNNNSQAIIIVIKFVKCIVKYITYWFKKLKNPWIFWLGSFKPNCNHCYTSVLCRQLTRVRRTRSRWWAWMSLYRTRAASTSWLAWPCTPALPTAATTTASYATDSVTPTPAKTNGGLPSSTEYLHLGRMYN